MVTPSEKLARGWHLIDAKGKILGRVATQVADKLDGHKKVNWSPMQDVGDHVVVINARGIRLSSDKASRKTYFHHTQYLGHMRAELFQHLFERRPTEVVRKAVYGMLPHKRFRKTMIRRLHVYPGDTHPHTKQFSK